MSQTGEIATLGGGCFWCLEAVYLGVEGVNSVESGYAGGQTQRPTYEQVCDGVTGHAEVVNVDFDPAKISYREILDIFFAIHDPTQLNRQGNDVGTQYRSVIFTHSDAQRETALQAIREIGEQGIYAGCAYAFENDDVSIYQVVCRKAGRSAKTLPWSRRYMYDKTL